MSDLSPVEQDRLEELGFTWAQLQEVQSMSHEQMAAHLRTMSENVRGFDRAALLHARIRLERMAEVERLVKAR
jgi:hypothetical protein